MPLLLLLVLLGTLGSSVSHASMTLAPASPPKPRLCAEQAQTPLEQAFYDHLETYLGTCHENQLIGAPESPRSCSTLYESFALKVEQNFLSTWVTGRLDFHRCTEVPAHLRTFKKPQELSLEDKFLALTCSEDPLLENTEASSSALLFYLTSALRSDNLFDSNLKYCLHWDYLPALQKLLKQLHGKYSNPLTQKLNELRKRLGSWAPLIEELASGGLAFKDHGREWKLAFFQGRYQIKATLKGKF